MASADISQQLKAGIAAAKAGDRQEAHRLLLEVLRADEENEQAWLWLSGVVTSKEERRICLENVLTLNPDNQMARRGLAKLGLPSEKPAPTEDLAPNPNTEEKVMRREYVPFSPASAILYPEHQVQEVRWQEPKIEQKAHRAEIRQASAYDDVWSRNVDICAYCAQELTLDTVICPKCKRNLSSKQFTYEKASSSMHIYWVLLVGLGQLFLIEAIVNVILGPNYLVAAGYLLLLVLFWGLAVGVYLRQSWAHLSSLIALLVVLTAFLLNSVVEIDYAALGLAALDSSIKEFVGSFIGTVLQFLTTFEVVTAVLALVYGIFKAGPDFERKTVRLAASVTKGQRTAPDYHNIARLLSEKGLWASAILHWQRAAAQEPGQVAYQKHLGLAYARLGFYQRSHDVLQSAYDMSTHPPTKAELAKHLQLVREKLAGEQQKETAVP